MLFCIYLMFCQWITTTYQTETKCPGSDWIHYAGNCYNLQKTASKTWQEAHTFCSHFNANLVSLTSQEEIDFLNKQGINYVWIGLYKTGTNNTWKWVDKSDVNLMLWDVGQPQSIGEDCGVAHSFDKLHDYPCYHNKSFVCKKVASTSTIDQSTTSLSQAATNTKRMTTLTSEIDSTMKRAITTLPNLENTNINTITSTPFIQSECPESEWLHYAGNCYNLQQTATKSWQEAQTFCSLLNANLVSLTSQDEIDFLNKQGINQVWIGLYKNGTNNSWKWVDKSDVNHIQWDKEQPGRIEENCGVVYSFDKWHDYPCLNRKPFVCKKATTSSPLHQYRNTTECPESDWLYYAGNCYNLQQNASKTWQEAQTFCSNFNANLVSLTSQDEIDFLNKQGIKYVWIGLYRTGTNDTWKWVDNSDVKLTKWDFRQPNSPEEDCGVAYSFDKLHDYPCYHNKSFVCKKVASTSTIDQSTTSLSQAATNTKLMTTLTSEMDTTINTEITTLSNLANLKINTIATPSIHAAVDLCPSTDWFYFAGSCYYFNEYERTWQESQDICSMFGANLVILNSQEEIDFLNSMGFKYLWIGLHKPKSYDRWQWVDKTAMKLIRWDFDQPDRTCEDCGVAYSFDIWHDYSCLTKKKMLCEKVVSTDPAKQIPDVDIGAPTANDVVTTTNNHACPNTYWFYYSGSCYYMDENKRTWQESQDICSSYGANLVILNSQEEIDFLNRQGLSYVWIGLHLPACNESWMWVDKTAMNLTRWDIDQPEKTGEECVLAHTFDTWHDFGCLSKVKFLCEKVVHTDGQATDVELGVTSGDDEVAAANDRNNEYSFKMFFRIF